MGNYKFKIQSRKKRKEVGDEKKSTLETYMELVKGSQKNFQVVLEQRNKAYTEINQLKFEIENLKRQINKQKESLFNLEKKSEIEINKIREEYEDKEKKWREITLGKNKEIGEVKKNFEDLLKRHKTLLCSEELLNDPDLKKEKSHFLEKLWKQTKKMKKGEVSKELEKPKVLNFENYIKSEKCICGKFKKYGSKGCANCKKEAEKFNKRDSLGMEKSWEKVWNSYGISLENPKEKTREKRLVIKRKKWKDTK